MYRRKHSVYLSILFYYTHHYLNLLTSIQSNARARLSLDKRRGRERKDEGQFFRTLLRVCSNSHRNSSTRAHGRFLSTTTTTRVDTLLHININVDFMFASVKELGLLQETSTRNIFSPSSTTTTILLRFLFLLLFCASFSRYFFSPLLSVQMLWSEPTIVSCCYYYRSYSSTTIVEMSFFPLLLLLLLLLFLFIF